jgi:ferredoxin-NADP reductase
MCGALVMERLQATVTNRISETHDVITLQFETNRPFINAQSGSYISVFFDETGLTEGKTYSLSSCPSDKLHSITVKKVGLFSGKLHDLKVGDKFSISQPYGYFNLGGTAPIVALAAGVGIAPIWSIVRDELSQSGNRPIKLFYSNKSAADIIFRKSIDELATKYQNFDCQYHITRDDALINKAVNRRINVSDDIASDDIENSLFYICGPTEFARSMRRQLIEQGVDNRNLSIESFFGEE